MTVKLVNNEATDLDYALIKAVTEIIADTISNHLDATKFKNVYQVKLTDRNIPLYVELTVSPNPIHETNTNGKTFAQLYAEIMGTKE